MSACVQSEEKTSILLFPAVHANRSKMKNILAKSRPNFSSSEKAAERESEVFAPQKQTPKKNIQGKTISTCRKVKCIIRNPESVIFVIRYLFCFIYSYLSLLNFRECRIAGRFCRRFHK